MNNLKKLTPEQVISICDNIINNQNSDEDIYAYVGLCSRFQHQLSNFVAIDSSSEIPYYIPEFTLDNALQFGAKSGLFWWRLYDQKNRRNFVSWIKEQYIAKLNSPELEKIY